MAQNNSEVRDEHYDLISVLYHALQGDETLAQYIADAESAEDEELAERFRDFQERYREIAHESKQLLSERLLAGEESENEEEK